MNLPEKTDPYWKNLLHNKMQYTSLKGPVKLMLTFTIQDFENRRITEEEAITKLYQLHKKYPKTIERDLMSIINVSS
ncbi:MAG: hypothetical protein ACFB0B_05505 [Thermonemataceae bacterium]|mgnify:CR=1 FL=1